MDCRKCSHELTAYLDGELPVNVAERMRQHLEECPPCHAELRDLKDAAVFVEAHVREVEPVPELWNNLRSRIADMPAPAGNSGFFHFMIMNRWAAAVATLAATVVLAFGLWGYMQYQASEKEFESYMSEYLLMRTVAERLHSVQLRQAKHIVADGRMAGLRPAENPFVELRPASLTNPFMSEER
jgi:hypothetical protein